MSPKSVVRAREAKETIDASLGLLNNISSLPEASYKYAILVGCLMAYDTWIRDYPVWNDQVHSSSNGSISGLGH